MLTFWVHSRMLMAIDVPQLSPHSASLPFCLRLWSPRIWPHTLCLQFLFLQVHSARCCQTNHPKTCFVFHRSLPLSEKLQPFSVYYEMKFKYGIKYPPKQAPQYFSSSSLFWTFPSNEGLLILSSLFIYLFIKETIIECQLYQVFWQVMGIQIW